MALPACAGCNVEEAEKVFRLAEERFLANDTAGALRSARKAQRLFRSLPGLANAVAAYEVHAAAAASRASGRNWYAVLSVGGGRPLTSGVTHDAIKQQYRRLCLVLHPDKNRSAAADGAFKLLKEAWETLSALHPPAPASALKPRADPPTAPPPPHASASSATPNYDQPPPAGSASAPKDRKRRTNQEQEDLFYSCRLSRQVRTRRITIYCRHCDSKFDTAPYQVDDKAGVKCPWCHERLMPPWQRRPTEGRRAPPPGADTEPRHPPPAPPRRREAPRGSKPWKFSCPGECPQCGTCYTAVVSVGMWHLRCRACQKYAMVHVLSPYLATTTT